MPPSEPPRDPRRRTAARGRFVGRSGDVAALEAAVRPGSVVTLVGPPGVGKTRLVREFAQQKRGKFDVVICEFSDAHTDDEVFSVLVRGLGADVPPNASEAEVLSTIGRALSGKEGLLLVLDNFEHLLRFASMVSRSAVLGPAVLVTSREPLSVENEIVLQVQPLSTASDADAPVSDAAQLFMDCLRSKAPAYEPTKEDVDVLSKWVVELDGLPLSIVLAAAATETPIRADQLALASDPDRGVGVAIDVSWSLLTPEEQHVLAVCSTFRGGFDEEAALAVLSAGTSRMILTSLAKKSLVAINYIGPIGSEGGALERSPGDTDRPSLLGLRKRFTMLGAIRDYAGAALEAFDAASPTEREVRERRFADFYALRASDVSEIEMGVDAREARRILEVDVDNLSLGYKLAIDHAMAEAAVEIALGISLVVIGRTPLSRTLSQLDAAVAAAEDEMDSVVAVRALIGRARVLELMGRAGEALTSARMARDIAQGLDDPKRKERGDVQGLVAQGAMARALLMLGRWREARDAVVDVGKAFDERGMVALSARAQITLGDTWFYEDDLAQADAAYARALATARLVGEPSVLGLARFRKAIVDMEKGAFGVAREGYESAIAAFRTAGDRGMEASAQSYLAVLEHDLGEFDLARARFETLAVTTRELGKRRQQGIAQLYLGALLVELRDLEAAETALVLAERILGELGVVSTEAYASGWRSVALAMRGDPDAAAVALARCQTILRSKKEQSFYSACASLFEGQLNLAHAQRARETGDDVAAHAHRALAQKALDEAPPPERSQSDVRIARRVLETALGLVGVSAAEGPKPSAERPLVIETGAAWFRPPDGERVDIETRLPLRRILSILAEARISRPGVPVNPTALMREVWQDTTDVSALQNRLRVGIATLRKLGLSKVLFTRPLGYLLSPDVTVLMSQDGRN